MRSDAAIPAGDIPVGLIDRGSPWARSRPAAWTTRSSPSPTGGPPRQWYFALAFTSTMLLIGLFFMGVTVYTGIGAWGNNAPSSGASDIINFVFWVGIGHAGTLISAILFIFRKRWRNAIARFAEAMTIFAVMCAGIFPLLHVGRPWLAYWLFPYPNQRGLWANFRSPLMWDVFAVSTYFSVSLMFWYLGADPRHRLHARPDHQQAPQGRVHRARPRLARRRPHWQHYEKAYLLLAGLATGLVLSVHSRGVASTSPPPWCRAGT